MSDADDGGLKHIAEGESRERARIVHWLRTQNIFEDMAIRISLMAAAGLIADERHKLDCRQHYGK